MKILEKIIIWVTIGAVITYFFSYNADREELITAGIIAKAWLAFTAVFLTFLLVSVHFFNRGLRRLQGKDFKGAIRAFTTAARFYPWFSTAYCNRAMAKSTLGDYDGAIADCDKGIKVNRKFPLPYCNRGVFKSKKKDYTGAVADFDKATGFKPDFALAYNNRGFIRAKYLNELDEALEDCRKNVGSCRLSQPFSGNCYMSLGYVYACRGHVTKALADCESAVKLDPEKAELWSVYACALAIMKNKEGMLEKLARAIELDPKQKEEALKDKDFEPYFDDPEFKRLVEE
jgi:tetratricopeptide (TPR) repeat protein